MRKLLTILIVFGSLFASAQGTDQQLADYYYTKGDFVKAQEYYEKLFRQEPSRYIFLRYYECLLQNGDEKSAEKMLKKQVNQNPYDLEYQVMLGQLYEDQGDNDKAAKIYDEMIESLVGNANLIVNTYTSFRNRNKYDLALRTLERGRKLLKSEYPLNFQFAEIYSLQGNTGRMIDEYLDLLDRFPSYQLTIQTQLARRIDFTEDSDEEYTMLRQKLLERVQKHPNEVIYSEMLIWLLLQKQNFDAALVQVEALDKRENGEGNRVMELGKMALENKNFRVARKAFQYVMDLGEKNIYFFRAESAMLNTLFREATTNRNFTGEEINTTVAAYERAITRNGYGSRTAPLIIEQAHILAFYANRSAEATENLEKLLATNGLTDMQRAEAKMQLADILVLHGDIWQASLYYMQVQKDFEYEIIGQEAKFKNARIFYFDGEFDFAQSQLDVLKESTSRLIANDAMQLSLLITDNFGLDSNYQAMTWFANADLLLEQHRYNEAFALYDSIIVEFPYHSLGDEIELRKAQAMEKQGKWEEAVSYYQELLKYHEGDILADDALYGLAVIYQDHLHDNETALEYLRKLLFEHPGSLYSVEARKRLRNLRGDGQEELWEN